MRMMRLSQWWWSKEKSIQFDCCKWKALSSRLMTNIYASALPSTHQMLTPFNISITLNWVIFYRLFSAKKPAYKYDEVCIFGDGKFKFSPPLDVSLQFKSWQYEFTDKSLTNWCAMKFEWKLSLSLFMWVWQMKLYAVFKLPRPLQAPISFLENSTKPFKRASDLLPLFSSTDWQRHTENIVICL